MTVEVRAPVGANSRVTGQAPVPRPPANGHRMVSTANGAGRANANGSKPGPAPLPAGVDLDQLQRELAAHVDLAAAAMERRGLETPGGKVKLPRVPTIGELHRRRDEALAQLQVHIDSGAISPEQVSLIRSDLNWAILKTDLKSRKDDRADRDRMLAAITWLQYRMRRCLETARSRDSSVQAEKQPLPDLGTMCRREMVELMKRYRSNRRFNELPATVGCPRYPDKAKRVDLQRWLHRLRQILPEVEGVEAPTKLSIPPRPGRRSRPRAGSPELWLCGWGRPAPPA